jgi:hypothetical protein
VGGLHCRRNVRRAVAPRVLVVFYLHMSISQGHFMCYPASRKIAVWMALVVASLRAWSHVVEERSVQKQPRVLKNTRTQTRESRTRHDTSTLNSGHQPSLYSLHHKTLLWHSWASIYRIERGRQIATREWLAAQSTGYAYIPSSYSRFPGAVA